MEGDGSLSIPSPESLPHNTHKKKYPLEWTHLIALCNCWSHLFFNERIRDAIIARRLEIGISNRSSLINARTATPPRIEQLSNNKIKWENPFQKQVFLLRESCLFSFVDFGTQSHDWHLHSARQQRMCVFLTFPTVYHHHSFFFFFLSSRNYKQVGHIYIFVSFSAEGDGRVFYQLYTLRADASLIDRHRKSHLHLLFVSSIFFFFFFPSWDVQTSNHSSALIASVTTRRVDSSEWCHTGSSTTGKVSFHKWKLHSGLQ